MRAQPVRCMVTTMLKTAALLTASLLLPGQNVLAIELHNGKDDAAGSTDD